MAAFSSTIYTAQNTALTQNYEAPSAVDFVGTVRVARVAITTTAGMADADTFNLVYLPAGAVVVPSMSKVQCSADPGTTLVLDIGTSSDTDAFADGIVLSSGGAIAFDANVCAQAHAPAALTAPTLVYATIPSSGAASVTADVTLRFWIAYTLP